MILNLATSCSLSFFPMEEHTNDGIKKQTNIIPWLGKARERERSVSPHISPYTTVQKSGNNQSWIKQSRNHNSIANLLQIRMNSDNRQEQNNTFGSFYSFLFFSFFLKSQGRFMRLGYKSKIKSTNLNHRHYLQQSAAGLSHHLQLP